MPSSAESANAIANTPQMPSGPSTRKIHAVYFARMCPMVFKGIQSTRKATCVIHTAETFRGARTHITPLFTETLPRITFAPILMHISSPRNIDLLQLDCGSACLQHADPFRPAPRCRDQPRPRSHARAQGKPFSEADPAGRYLRRSQLRPPHQRALEVSRLHSQALQSQAQHRGRVGRGQSRPRTYQHHVAPGGRSGLPTLCLAVRWTE